MTGLTRVGTNRPRQQRDQRCDDALERNSRLGDSSMSDYVLHPLPTTPMDILSFWFSDQSRPKWFEKDPSFDAVVSARYGAVLQAAKRGELFKWRETIRGRLVEIIVLDQFSRNIHRGTAAAFESDAQAQEAVRDE